LRVAEFLLLNPEFPHSVRFSVDKVHTALRAIAELTERKAEQPVRLAGRLRAIAELQPDRRGHGLGSERGCPECPATVCSGPHCDSPDLF
jgi:uncharacterized alpha-E superfamily protein